MRNRQIREQTDFVKFKLLEIYHESTEWAGKPECLEAWMLGSSEAWKLEGMYYS
jgi:hypothetical protein